MALTQRLQIRQSQALVMTPQLMQAIKLLQLSNLDLVAYVEAELERNPLLDSGAEDERAPAENGPEQTQDNPSADGETWNAGETEPSRNTIEDALDTRTEDVFPDAEITRPRAAEGPAGYSEWAAVGAGGRDDGEYNLEAFVPAETTLADWLREQLALAVALPARRMIGQYLIDRRRGRLCQRRSGRGRGKTRHQHQGSRGGARHAAKLRSAGHLRARSGRVPDAAAQRAQPLRSGDGGLDRTPRSSGEARLRRAERKSAASTTNLVDMIAEIRRLNPKPGLAFGSAIVQPIVPDVFDAAGSRRLDRRSIRTPCRRCWSIRPTTPKFRRRRAATPTNRISPNVCRRGLAGARARPRARTILKVANEIVRQQDGSIYHDWIPDRRQCVFQSGDGLRGESAWDVRIRVSRAS